MPDVLHAGHSEASWTSAKAHPAAEADFAPGFLQADDRPIGCDQATGQPTSQEVARSRDDGRGRPPDRGTTGPLGRLRRDDPSSGCRRPGRRPEHRRWRIHLDRRRPCVPGDPARRRPWRDVRRRWRSRAGWMRCHRGSGRHPGWRRTARPPGRSGPLGTGAR